MRVWAATGAGLCGSLVGIGLARFAYSPLIPALIAAGWFTPAGAAYLGAANLAGYLAGAVAAQWVVRRMGARRALRAMMLLATAAFFACAWRLGFGWFFVWRFASGVSGGVIMVLGATLVLPHVALARRGVAGGVIFTGVGLGIVASGTLVPLLLRLGMAGTWLGLGALCGALTAAAWFGWPRVDIAEHGKAGTGRLGRAAWAVIVEYGLNAAGLVPSMIFLVDFIARGLGWGVAVGSAFWVLYGLGATVGPLVLGRVADRIGFRLALRIGFLVQAAAALLPVVTHRAAWLGVSSVVVGGFTPGMVLLVLGRLHEVVPRAGQRRAWGYATVSFGVFQAAAAYAYSAVFAREGGSYRVIFAAGVVATLIALALDCVADREPEETLA